MCCWLEQSLMTHAKPVLAAFGLLVVVGTVLAADDPKEVDFPDYAVKFTVPKGWKVLKQEKAADHAWCVLQQVSKVKNKATICVYAGRKYVDESPENGNLTGGQPFAATAWAFMTALAWSEGNMDGAPKQARAEWKSMSDTTFGKISYIGGQSQVGEVLLFGLCSDERPGGQLTIGCACTPKSAIRTQQVLETVIGKRGQ